MLNLKQKTMNEILDIPSLLVKSLMNLIRLTVASASPCSPDVYSHSK